MFALAVLLIINDEHKYLVAVRSAYGSFARNFLRARNWTELDSATAASTPLGASVYLSLIMIYT